MMLKGMKLGDCASISRVFSPEHLTEFQALAGHDGGALDYVPEPLIGALFSYLLGVKLPGPGTNYLKQEMTFLEPAPVGVPLTATVEIARLRPDKQLVDLATTCTAPDGRLLCQGRALVLVIDVPA
jgi:3-hydroxybutyryl-CoA dehydratase